MTWYRQPFFWTGWLSGGMVSVVGYAIAQIATGTDPGLLSNVGYAVASLPPIAAAVFGWWYLRKKGRELRQQYADAAKAHMGPPETGSEDLPD